MKIGIIGKGFVGSAVQFGFSPNVGCDADVKVYDKDINKSTHSLDEVVNDSEYVFISVPTPASNDGKINLDILVSSSVPIFLVLSHISQYLCSEYFKFSSISNQVPGCIFLIPSNKVLGAGVVMNDK